MEMLKPDAHEAPVDPGWPGPRGPRLWRGSGSPLGPWLARCSRQQGVRVASPAPLSVHGDPNRGAFTTPGDHPVRTDEYAAVVHVNADGFVDRDWGPATG